MRSLAQTFRFLPKGSLYPALGALQAIVGLVGFLAIERLLGESSAIGFPGAVGIAYLVLWGAGISVVLGRMLGRKQDQLEVDSHTDSLTGIANRRLFDSRLTYEIERAHRFGQSVALMLIDLDWLKKLNDEGGHEAGDAALRVVAHALAQCSRTIDLSARIGGDEFAVLLPATTAVAALRLAMRINHLVRHDSAGFEHGPVSVSIGVADLRRATELSGSALYRAADQALYAAKAQGRGRIMFLAENKADNGRNREGRHEGNSSHSRAC